MATLKYKDSQGNLHPIIGYNITYENEVVLTTGNSTTAVMSLKGVTDVITENEEVVSTALNDLNDRVENLEEVLAVSAVEYNTTAKKITETINGVTSDVVTASDIVIDGGGLTSIQAVAGSHINEAGTPTVTASTIGDATTLTFDYLKGASGTNGTTPTIKASAGSAIGSVGTPSVSASTSGTTTTFTFNYLKGATGAQGPQGPKGDKGATGPQGPAGVTNVSFVTGNCTVIAGSGGYLAYLPYTVANAKKVYSLSFFTTNNVGNLNFLVPPYCPTNTAYGKTVNNAFVTMLDSNPGTTTYRLIVAS